MGTLVISKKENNTYKYTYNNRKGNVVFTSNSYASKAHCLSEINILKRNFTIIQFIHYKTPSGKLFFKVNLNDHILGVSRKFTTPLLMEKGLNDLKNNFIRSEVLDFTEDVFEMLPEEVF
ncbi:hypothetical protein MG290_05560 [Flavobacterium sp. CBA20B-1]|uniref:GIY-YIG homing endonuclease n=1 Tax=Paenimyroides aestuarii TaxID=2968490 RepID=A0ABY5NP99_9FLAO|nr:MULTISPECIES: hypothetical protein [Flavobacteriaceae]UUV20380.1 hypothetical protein NPX36_08360 [Paenimyroides aestuarii]WCM43136.1 hypothetical protein MG290_05560 [Flavobacterium sp. CBA20B-1]